MAVSLAVAGEVLRQAYRDAGALEHIKEGLRTLESFKPPVCYVNPSLASGLLYEMRAESGRRIWIIADPDAWLFLLAGLEILEGRPEHVVTTAKKITAEDWNWGTGRL